MLGLGNSLIKGGLTGPTIVTDGLVLKHKYDASAVVPVSDGAAFFGGSTVDDYIDCGAIDLGTAGFSVGGWFWINSTQADQFATLVGEMEYDSHGRGFIIRFNNNNLQFGTGDDTSGDSSEYSNFLTTSGLKDNWVHVMGTLSGGTSGDLTRKFYVNGVLITNNTSKRFLSKHASVNFSIGKSLNINNATSALLGYSSNVGLWTSVLTQAQIKSIMWKNYADLTTSETTSLVSWWNLDTETNTSGEAGTGGVKDSHGTNHGTLT